MEIIDRGATTSFKRTSEHNLVLGTAALSGPANEDTHRARASVPPSTAFEIFDAAWAAGIRLVDTAPGYGEGEGYTRLLSWRSRVGHQFQLIVKPGRPFIQGRFVSVIEEESLIAEVDQATALFGQPNAILIKDPPSDYFYDGRLISIMDVLTRRYPSVRVGLVSHQPADCSTLPAAWCSRTIQIEYSGVNWWSAAPLASDLRRKGWSVWSMQPLAYGFLSGRYTVETSFPPSECRGRMSRERRKLILTAAGSFLTRLTAQVPGVAPAILAIAFCLSDRNIERVVIGPKSTEQLKDALAAVELANTKSFRSIADAIRKPLLDATAKTASNGN